MFHSYVRLLEGKSHQITIKPPLDTIKPPLDTIKPPLDTKTDSFMPYVWHGRDGFIQCPFKFCGESPQKHTQKYANV